MDIKNPLHGKYAQPIGSSSDASGGAGSFKSQNSSSPMPGNEKTEIKWIKVIVFFSLALVALYPVVLGVHDLFLPNENNLRLSKNAEMVKIQHKETTEPTFFEKLFCRGARRSSWCGQNGDESSR